MPVIVIGSPKGGVGKSTCAVLLAIQFSLAGPEVTVLDCDPNRSVSRWASKNLPNNILVVSEVSKSDVISTIKENDGDGKLVIVDLEGVASQLVSRAISQADLVIVPMQATALDAAIGSEALALVREEEETLGRTIKHAVVLTKTNAAIKTRVRRELEQQLKDAGVDVIEPSLVQRAAFGEIFAFGGTLADMENNKSVSTAGNVENAIANAQGFMEAVYERLI
ncbi:MAG: ParA family protein [Erythrobacter sp.]